MLCSHRNGTSKYGSMKAIYLFESAKIKSRSEIIMLSKHILSRQNTIFTAFFPISIHWQKCTTKKALSKFVKCMAGVDRVFSQLMHNFVNLKCLCDKKIGTGKEHNF